MSLRELLEVILKRMWMIGLITLLAGTAAGIVSHFLLTPKYEVSTELLIVNQSESKNELYDEIQSSMKLMETYSIIMKSPPVLEEVINNNHLELSPQDLTNKMKVKVMQNSQVMSLSVIDADPQKAALMANSIAETFQVKIAELMSVNNIKILSPAKAGDDPSPVSPKPLLLIAIALICSFTGSIGLALLLEKLPEYRSSASESDRAYS